MYNARASTNISHTDKIWNQVAACVNMQNRHKASSLCQASEWYETSKLGLEFQNVCYT